MTTAQVVTFIRLLSRTDTNNFSNANVLILLNDSMENIAGKILSETTGGGWKFGDPAYTALPTYTFNLVAGTAFYQIDALTTPLIILAVEAADENGTYHILKPITLEDIHRTGVSQSSYLSTNGFPIEYEKREHGVILYPAPAAADVTLTNGGRIFFLRGMSALTDATSTTAISFPSPMHGFLAYDVAHMIAIARGLDNVNQLQTERDRREKYLMSFFARRNQDDRPVMTMAPIEYI